MAPVLARLLPSSRSRALAVVGLCVVIATASLAIPNAPGYDPWSWLVWGREITRWDLDTRSGPSWKPLPVLFTTLAAPFGSAQPEAWTVVARTAGLLLLVGCYRLASRAAGTAAGLVAAGLVLLTPDLEPRFLRTLIEAHDAPMTAALAVWAVERHQAGRPRQVVLLGTLLALSRPEAWPFLGIYGLWCWRTDRVPRSLLVALALSIPVLWFGGDWLGSGRAVQGAETAQVYYAPLTRRFSDALSRAGQMVPVPAWAAAGAAVWWARRERQTGLLAVAGLALAWTALVVAMAVGLGFAAISRFYLPAAALICVLAGIGVVRTVRAVDAGPARIVAIGIVVAASAPFLVPRVIGVSEVTAKANRRAAVVEDLDHMIGLLGGPAAVESCGAVAVEHANQLKPALAWRLDRPLRGITRFPREGPAVVLLLRGWTQDRRLQAAPESGVVPVVATKFWRAYTVGCDRLVPA